MKVTVVIPCYNHYKYIAEAIDSVRAQTYKNIEIIIVDDCSTELLEGKFISEYVNYLDIPVIHHPRNRGLAATRNTGICAIPEDDGLVLPLDADDKIHPTCIEKMVAQYKYRERDIISTYLETFGQYTRVSKPHPSPTWEDLRITNRLNCCSLFSRKMWWNLGGYDELMRQGYEDWEFWLRATKYGYKIHTIPEILFYYRKHAPGESMLDKAKQTKQETVYYMRRKGSI